MTSKWDNVDAAIVMMCVVYVHGGVVTKLDVPGGVNRMVKDF